MLLNINMAANDIYTKFYFINVIKCIILLSCKWFFPVSHPRENRRCTCKCTSGASGAIKFTVLIFAVTFYTKATSDFSILNHDWYAPIGSKLSEQVNRCQIVEFRTAWFDRSIHRHFEEDACVHFTRICTCRHVRATRTSPTPFNYWIKRAFTAVKGN